MNLMFSQYTRYAIRAIMVSMAFVTVVVTTCGCLSNNECSNRPCPCINDKRVIVSRHPDGHYLEAILDLGNNVSQTVRWNEYGGVSHVDKQMKVFRHPSGHLSMVILDLGNNISQTVRWYEDDGSVSNIRREKDGKPSGGLYEYFYPNGIPFERSELFDGKGHGVRRRWAFNGTLTYWLRCENRNPMGAEQWWNEDGVLLGELNYQDGEPFSGVAFADSHPWGASYFHSATNSVDHAKQQAIMNGVPEGKTIWYGCPVEKIGTKEEKIVASCEFRNGQPYSGTMKQELGEFLYALVEFRNGVAEGKVTYLWATYLPGREPYWIASLSEEKMREASQQDLALPIEEGHMRAGKEWSGIFIKPQYKDSDPSSCVEQHPRPRNWRVETWKDGLLQSSSETKAYHDPIRPSWSVPDPVKLIFLKKLLPWIP